MILILTIISSMLSVTAPYLLGLFFDALIASASIVRIMYICLIYLLLMTCTLFVGYELNLLKVKVHTKASYRLNSEVLFYIHRLPYDTTMFMDSSYYTQRINNDATQIISYILEALSGIIINVVSIILPSVVIFNIFPPILPGIFLAIMLYVFAYTAMRSVLYKTGMAFKEGQSVFFKKLSQQLTAIKLIKLFDLSDLFADLLNKAFAHVLKTTINYQKKAYIFSSLDSLISSVCQILFLFSGGYMVSKNLGNTA